MPMISAPKKANFIQVVYGGVPSGPNGYMPHNGAAQLAAILLDAGHHPLILDYGALSTTRRLFPESKSKQLQTILSELLKISQKKKELGSLGTRDKIRQIRWFLKLKSVDSALQKHRTKEEMKIAEEIMGEVAKAENPVLGFSIYSGDSFTGSLAMAEAIKKKHPNLKIFAGGPQVKFWREKFFNYSNAFDAISYWDSELAIVPLMEYALGQRKIEEVPNIIFKHNGKPQLSERDTLTNMDELLFPVYSVEVYPAMESNSEKIKMTVLEDRRGCENQCVFCIHPYISGTTVRLKSAPRIVAEMENLRNRYGLTAVRFGGSTSPTQHLLKIAIGLSDKGIDDMSWAVFLRAKDANPESFKTLRDSGLKAVFIGIESGDQKILDGLNKKTSVERIKRTVLAAKSAGIHVAGSVIVPAPFETEETFQTTLNFLNEIGPDSVSVQPLGIYPGTPLSRDPHRFNLEIMKPTGFRKNRATDYNNPKVLDYLIRYKINLHLPPDLWKPLPWTVNGMNHKQFMQETMRFYNAVKEMGIIPNLTDEEALMAMLGGYDYRDFQENTFRYFFCGMTEDLEDMNRRINQGIKR